jgi:two-component system, OmpR family, sensor histidine kinase KdpD
MDLKWLERRWFGYFAAVTLVVVATLVPWALHSSLGRGFDALILLVLVGVVARAWGTGPGLVAAAVSFFALGLLSTPFFFNIHPDNITEWIESVVYVVATAFLALQVGRLRDREASAVSAEREARAVSRLTAALIPDTALEEVGEEVVSSVEDLTGAGSVALLLPDERGVLDAFTHTAVPGASVDMTVGEIVRYVWERGVAVGLPESQAEVADAGRWPESVPASTVTGSSRPRRDVILPLQGSEGRVVGVLYVGARANDVGYDATTASRLVLASRLVAVFMERHRLQDEAARAEAAVGAEKLRASMISSVSHELKTPLAAINATVTGLLDEADPDGERVRRELGYISEDVQRLNRSINDLLDLSRLETEDWLPSKDWHDLADVVGSVVSDLPERDRARIVLDLPEEPVLADMDFVQISRAVFHLVENALAYSPADQRVVVSVCTRGDSAIATVTDRGPGVPASERSRIFEKFYRGAASAAVPHGTGLGLSIVAEIVARHGGLITVEEARPNGARFVLELPGAGGNREAMLDDTYEDET